MSNTGREQLSDDWPDIFDDGVGANGADFPFAGYGQVLSTVIEEGLGVGPRRLLDLGYGTGTLLAAARTRSDDAELWGLDRSVNVLERAHGTIPAANLVQADDSRDPPRLTLPAFDAIVSTYALHELPDDRMRDLLEHRRSELLQPRTDTDIVVGDIGMANDPDLAAVRTQTASWDDTEHKLVADRSLADLASKGIAATYQQRSSCGGVLVIHGDE